MVDCHIHMVLDGVNWKDAIARHKAAPQEAPPVTAEGES